jgi:peptidoglycan/xylan/chitin deacetylase (PgdA/CDA1 family)
MLSMSNSNKLTVLMYHYVRDLKNSNYPEIKGLDISDFIEQVRYIKRHYNFISMEQLIDSIYNDDKLPPKAVLMTFDDAYKDHYDYVFPVLLKNNISGAFYTPVKAITEHKVLDVNKIHFILASTDNMTMVINSIFEELDNYRIEYQLEANKFYYKKYAVATRFDNAQVVFIKRILQFGLQKDLRIKIVDKLFKQFVKIEEHTFSKELYMNPVNIKEMLAAGMHIGSHGYDHYWLNSLDRNEQENEINKSLDFLTKIGVNTNFLTMCYPYGVYNGITKELLEIYNFKAAFTTNVDIATTSYSSRFEISRLDTNDLPKSEFHVPNEWFNKA